MSNETNSVTESGTNVQSDMEVSKSTDSSNSLKEGLYLDLRAEIREKANGIDEMFTFAITAVIGIITFVFETNNNEKPSFFLLFPVFIIIFVTMRALSNRRDIAKISEYIMARKLEPVGAEWEMENSKLIKHWTTSVKYWSPFIVHLACIFIYGFQSRFWEYSTPCFISVSVFILFITIVELCLTIKLTKIGEMRKTYHKVWNPNQKNNNAPKEESNKEENK